MSPASAQSPLSVVLKLQVDAENGALIEVPSPATQLLIEHRDPGLGLRCVPLAGGLLVDLIHDPQDRFLGGVGTDVRLSALPVEASDRVTEEVERLSRYAYHPRLLFVHRKPDLLHDLRHCCSRSLPVPRPTADHKIIGIVDHHRVARFPAAQLFPGQQKAAEVDVGKERTDRRSLRSSAPGVLCVVLWM